MITKEDVAKGISYYEYYNLIEKLVAERKTTGEDQSEKLVDYTKLNFSRMKRIMKTMVIPEEAKNIIENINCELTWLVLIEGWCADAAQNLPVVARLAELNNNISVRVLLRDENLDIMDQYLTNGGRSVPKLICLDERLNEVGTWGPRPKFLQDWMKKEKENPTMEMADLKKEFQVWYTKDKGQTLIDELIKVMSGCVTPV